MKKIIQILICTLIGIFVATENIVLATDEPARIMLFCGGREETSSYCNGSTNIKTEFDESCYSYKKDITTLYNVSTICTDEVTGVTTDFASNTCTINVKCNVNPIGLCAAGAWGTASCTTENNIISCTGCNKCPDYLDADGKTFTGQSVSGNNEERSDCYITTSATNPISDDTGKYYFSENSGKCNASPGYLDPIRPIDPINP